MKNTYQRTKASLRRAIAEINWKFKFGWECVGGHYVMDDAGRIAKPTVYCYVWMNRRNHTIRLQKKFRQ